MNTETLQGIGWLILWGGLFYFMMRFGCGAHMMGGHGGHKHSGHGNAAYDGEAKDPVCGMSVDAKNAAAAAVHGGNTYYFCSTSCRDKFVQAPDQYAGAPAHGGHQHG